MILLMVLGWFGTLLVSYYGAIVLLNRLDILE